MTATGSPILRFSAIALGLGLLTAGCSQDQQGIQATVDAKLAAAIATVQAKPTVTPQPTPTPYQAPPYPTPLPTPTPVTFLATATPIALPPTPRPAPTPTVQPAPTAIVLPPTPTPITFPPTPTAIVLPPTPTPILLPTASTPAADWSQTIKAARRSVVRINSPSGPLLGSGVYIGEGYILTQEHIIRGFTNVMTTASAGTLGSPATARGWNVAKDIALLKIDVTWDLPSLELRATNQGDVGQPVALIGYPLFTDDSPSASMGVISRYLRLSGLGWLIETDAAYNPGDNGGPLLDRSGKVVGIMQMTAAARQEGMAWASTSDEILPILDALKGGSKT